jgi:CRP-like cAMP-binding protein
MDIETLRKVPLFHDLSDKDLKQILTIGKEVRHEAGKRVVEEDHPGVGFHMILEGEAEAAVGGEVMTKLGPGDYFGDISLIDGGPRSATVTAITDVRTYAIPAWNFGRLLDQNPSIMKGLLVELCRRLRRMGAALHTT